MATATATVAMQPRISTSLGLVRSDHQPATRMPAARNRIAPSSTPRKAMRL